jgi:hypothetical protein
MDAPLYPPATVFEQPVRVARQVSTRNTPIADLMKIPAAWAIIEKELPGIEPRLNTEALKPHLGNFSFRSLLQYGFARPEQLDRIDEKLRALGEVK